jgi:hypothetical protein
VNLRDRARSWLGVIDAHVRPRVPLKIHAAALQAALAPPAAPRRVLRLPDLPPGVAPEGAADMAMDYGGQTFSSWAWSNNIQGIGCGLFFPGYPYLAELAQRSEYRAPTETISKEMTRKWIVFQSTGKGDKEEKIKQIEDAFKRFKVRESFRRVAGLDGFFGRGQIYIDIKGQENARDVPLLIGPETIKKGDLNALTVIEPMWTTPVVWNAMDPTASDFYRPTTWYVLGRKTDATRLMTFISREVPDLLKPSYNFGGVSMSQLIEPYVMRWLGTVQSVNNLIRNFSILFLQTNMLSVLQGENASDLIRRAQLFTQTRDNQGFFLTDKDTELLGQLAVPLSGLDHLQSQAQEHMAAPTHIPLVVLTGITPSGLNASSDGEIEVFHNFVNSSQEALFTDHLDKVLQLIQLNEFGFIDPDIDYDYVLLKEVDGEALARIRKSDGEAAAVYINAGVIDPQEERERLAYDPDSGYEGLDIEKVIEPPAVQMAQLGAQLDEGDSDGDGE